MFRTMGIGLFLLDWSGTVSDDRIPVHAAVCRQLAAYGLPQVSFPQFFLEAEMEPRKYFLKKGVDLPAEQIFADYKRWYDEVCDEGIHAQVYADAANAFQTLHAQGKTVAIVSSHPAHNIWQEASRYGLHRFLAAVEGNARVKETAIASVMQRLGHSGDALYLGDTEFDVRAAHAAGVFAAAIAGPDGQQRGYHDRQRLLSAQPHYLLESLEDLTSEESLQRRAVRAYR